MKRIILILSGFLLLFTAASEGERVGSETRTPSDDTLPFAPRQYVCYRTTTPLQIDGMLTDEAWQAAPWTDFFVDIRGGDKRTPRHRTRAKMLWDDAYFYVAATLDEPDLWATLTQRDTVVFYDNDFELFIDPDGDTHAYYELEINALETVWDLMLLKPYRDGGPAINGWDIRGLESAVHIEGTLNDPRDSDRGWTVELAVPWQALEEAAPHQRPPQAGEQWRVNFSRVQWQLAVEEGRYVKKVNPKTGKHYREDNWVWSPQGVVNMHKPERWGYVQFSDIVAAEGSDAFVEDPNEQVKWALRRLYYRQVAYHDSLGRYASALHDLNADEITVDDLDFAPTMQATERLYQISADGFNGKTLHIRHDGKVWRDS